MTSYNDSQEIYCVCLNNSGGYTDKLTVGKTYKVEDIQDGIFKGDYYVIVTGDNNEPICCHNYRFDITKEYAKEYVNKYHGAEYDKS